MYRRNTIDFFIAANEFSTYQDTVKQKSNVNTVLQLDSTVKKKVVGQDTVKHQSIQKLNFSAIDSIMQKSEERELQIQAEIQEQLRYEAALQRWYNSQNDSAEILYKEFGIAGFPIKEKLDNDLIQQNFMYNFSSIKPEEKQEENVVFIENQSIANTERQTSTSTKQDISQIIPNELAGKIQFDWITIVLIACILLLGWVRLFNKKYLSSLVKSAVSFQESVSLYREKNSLMEKASFMFNILFLSTISVFIIQLCILYGVKITRIENYIFYLILMGSFVGLYLFRLITSSLIGYIFKKQNLFSEFFHSINIYTKITGLFLLPIVIILQFLSYEYLPFFAYMGISVITLLYILHIVRSFQIIIRKNVSISYMILYLCAFEFAPFLIVYKIVLSSI